MAREAIGRGRSPRRQDHQRAGLGAVVAVDADQPADVVAADAWEAVSGLFGD